MSPRPSLSPREEGMSFWVCLISFCPFLGLWVHLAWLPAVLAHWAFTFFLRLSWPICLASTSYYICGPAGPLGFYLFLRGPHDPFALFLPLTTPVGLLAHWALTSFFGPAWPICFVLPLSLSSHGSFFMLFPLVVLMGLLAAISCHTSPLGFLSFFLLWAFVVHLLLFFFFHSFLFLFLLVIRPFCYWALFIKNGYQHTFIINQFKLTGR